MSFSTYLFPSPDRFARLRTVSITLSPVSDMSPPALPAFRGFTLIELLVALLILTLLSTASYRGLNAVLGAREQVAAETRKWQHLSNFFARMEQDIAQAIARPVRDGDTHFRPAWSGHNIIAGEDDAQLTFTRAGIPDQGAEMLAPQRIAYRLDQGSIVMLHWSALDPAPRARPLRYPLLTGVDKFELRYLDRYRNWQAQWPPAGMENQLPVAAEVALTLVSGERIVRTFALQ